MKDGVQDWDCAEALDLERFGKVLREVKEGGGGGDGGDVLRGLVRQGGIEGGEGEGDGDGVHRPTTTSGNAVNDGSIVSEATITRLRKEIHTSYPPTLRNRQIVIVEGFLLFGKSLHLHNHSPFSSIFDLKILLRASYEEAKRRREGRNGYVTLEGFWKDPEGYFDRVVWRGYVQEHAWIFEGGDVEGRVKENLGEEEGDGKGDTGVRVGPLVDGLDWVLEWVLGELSKFLVG